MRFTERSIYSRTPFPTKFGYLIDGGGMIYTMTEAWMHGKVLAELYPDDSDRIAYCEPELRGKYSFPIVRISIDKHNQFNVNNLCADPATVDQISAMTRCLKECNISLNDIVQTDSNEMTARRMLELLTRE